MKVLRKSFALISCLVCVSLPLAAQQDTAPDKPDDRLSKKLTITMTRGTIEELLAEATKQSGVTMVAIGDKKAWKVREMPVSVQVKEITVKDFQDQIAKLFDYRWIKSGETGAFKYTLWQDQNARDREAKALRSAEDERLAKMTEGWTAATEEVADYLNMSPDEIAKLGDDQKYGKFLATDEFGRSFAGMMGAIGPGGMDSLLSGDSVRLGYNQLNPMQQASMGAFANGLGFFQSKLENKPYEEYTGDWNKVSLTVRPLPDFPGTQMMADIGFLGFLELNGTGTGMGFPIVNPNSPMAELMAEAIDQFGKGAPAAEVMRSIGEKMGEKMKEAAKKKDAEAAEAAKSEPTDPRLLQEVDIKKSESGDPVAMLKPISDETGLQFVGEAWKRPGSQGIVGKKKVIDHLKAVEGFFGTEWVLDKDTVRIKDKEFAKKRDAMVPQADITYWKDYLKENKFLTLDDLAHVATIYNRGQIMTLVLEEQSLAGHIGMLLDPQRKAGIEFYASLSKASKASAKAEGGMSPFALSPKEQNSMLALLRELGISEEDYLQEGSIFSINKKDTVWNLTLNWGEKGLRSIVLANEVETNMSELRRPPSESKPAE